MTKKTMPEPEITEPLTIEEFAKYIGASYEEISSMPFPEFTHFVKKQGFFISGSGLIPKPGGYKETK